MCQKQGLDDEVEVHTQEDIFFHDSRRGMRLQLLEGDIFTRFRTADLDSLSKHYTALDTTLRKAVVIALINSIFR